MNYVLALMLFLAAPLAVAADGHAAGRSEYRAPRAAVAPVIDGVTDDAAWDSAHWREIDQRWLGPEYDASDFQGRFKVVWTPKRIYLLAEIVDDILFDSHRNPLVQYWDDDTLEIFIDEDFSGGEHQYNHIAFAYHVSLDNQAIDIGTDKAARSYSHHVLSRWRQQGDKVVWELAIDVYPDTYRDDAPDDRPVQLSPGKVLGLLVAYCENDGSELRENFVGSEAVTSGAKDRAWITWSTRSSEQVTRLSDADRADTSSDRVPMMTVHVAKGLEFKHVFVVGLEEGIFPHFASLDDPSSIEEERRLCYVAMTRAMERLTLSNASMRRMHGSVRYNAPSRFLAEIPEELLAGRRRRTTRPSEPTFEPGPRVDFSDAQWAADDLPVIREGMRVEHPIFGLGRISEVAGAGESAKLTIQFERAGAKMIKLKYAQLRILA